MTGKVLGKISYAEVGFGGYQDVQVGVTIGLDCSGCCCADFKGQWAEWSKGCEWTVQDQITGWGHTMAFIRDILADAKKQRVSQLKGVPVEVEFAGNALKSWRILKEVL